MKSLPAFAAWSLLAALPAAPAMAIEASASSANVKVRLVPEVLSIQAGKAFTVALHMTMAPLWHTYWKNPGDSGMPTRIVWTLPDGFKASELRWPVPVRAADGGLALYGYEHEATFLTEITPGSDLPKGRFTLAAKVTWLECKDICIPGKANLDLTLPSAPGSGRAALDPASKALFTAARAAMPRSSAAMKASHSVEGGRLILKVAGPPGSGIAPRVLPRHRRPHRGRRTSDGFPGGDSLDDLHEARRECPFPRDPGWRPRHPIGLPPGGF